MNVKIKVMELLRNHKSTRNSDIDLYIKYLESEGGELDSKMKQTMKQSYPPETITRARRHIQNEMRLYEAEEEVEKERIRKEEEYREEPSRIWEGE